MKRLLPSFVALLFAFAGSISADSLFTTIKLPLLPGGSPYAVALDSVSNRIYVTHNSYGVTQIDGVHDTTADILTGNAPRSLCINDSLGTVYVANWFDGTVTSISESTKIPTSITVGSGPQGTKPQSIPLNQREGLLAKRPIYLAQ